MIGHTNKKQIVQFLFFKLQILNYLDLLVGRFTQAQELMVGGEPLLRGRGGALQVYWGRSFTGILGA